MSKNIRPELIRVNADQARRASGAAGGHLTARAKARPGHGTRGSAKRAALKEQAA